MFRRSNETQPLTNLPASSDRVTTVLGPGISWKGHLSGSGGVRIEGAFDGDIALNGMLVIGESGRVTCKQLRADVVIIAGAVRGDITTKRLEIRATGRVWGNVVTTAFATEEGAFLRGQVTMEERLEADEESPNQAEAPEEDEDDR